MPVFDFAIVGGGIVGLATGLKILERETDLQPATCDLEGLRWRRTTCTECTANTPLDNNGCLWSRRCLSWLLREHQEHCTRRGGESGARRASLV